MLSKTEKDEILNELRNESKKIEVEVVRDIVLPKYAHIGDAGADVRSAIDIDIKPGETVLIPLGFKMNIPMSYQIEVRPRSGLSLKTPLRLSNSPGTIDSGYKDEICVIMTNTSRKNKGNYNLDEKDNHQGTYHIAKGDRVAQIVLTKYEVINFVTVDSIDKNNDRGGGFGHTGVE